MKLLTQKSVRKLDASERKVMLKQSIEMSNHYVKVFSQTIKLMQKHTGIDGRNYLCNDPGWMNHPLYDDLIRIESLQYKHDANTRLLRDL